MSKHQIIDLGFGKFEVMQGAHDKKYSLMIGSNGNGIIGESISKDRYVSQDELLLAITFANVSSVDVVINQLQQLKYNMENKLPYLVKNEFGETIETIRPKIEN